MTDFAPLRRQRNDLNATATARPLAVSVLLALSVLAACAGDLDPRYGSKSTAGGGTTATGTGNGTASGTASGTNTPATTTSTGSGGSPAPTGSGGAQASTGTGSATTGGGTGPTTTAACTYAQTVLPARCGFNGCHGMTGTPPDLSSDAMAAAIIGEGAATPCDGTSTTALIDKTSPVSGVLLTRITTKTCGTGQMPFGATALSQTEIDCIKSYFMSKLH